MNLTKQSTKAPEGFGKEKTKQDTGPIKESIGELQNLMYAEGKHAVLIVLQGMDASGKDGVIKKVFEEVNPMGCRVIPFKKPTELEVKHDFLWRIHQQVPEKGMIHIFNRSHYEDVLIQRVHKWVDKETIIQRYNHINNFEKLLIENNVLILKFFLNVSKEEQLERLNERMSDPTKMWKYNANDIKEREYWDDYMEAYQAVLDSCSDVPWHVIPADQNWYKEFLIADIVAREMEKLKMNFPALIKE